MTRSGGNPARPVYACQPNPPGLPIVQKAGTEVYPNFLSAGSVFKANNLNRFEPAPPPAGSAFAALFDLYSFVNYWVGNGGVVHDESGANVVTGSDKRVGQALTEGERNAVAESNELRNEN